MNLYQIYFLYISPFINKIKRGEAKQASCFSLLRPLPEYPLVMLIHGAANSALHGSSAIEKPCGFPIHPGICILELLASLLPVNLHSCGRRTATGSCGSSRFLRACLLLSSLATHHLPSYRVPCLRNHCI